MLTTILGFFGTAWAWILAHKALLFPVVMVMLVLKLFAWLFKGVAVCIGLLLKPDPEPSYPGYQRKTLRPKGLGMDYFVKPHWDKARDMYIPRRKLL
jgi:hypothetical protein